MKSFFLFDRQMRCLVTIVLGTFISALPLHAENIQVQSMRWSIGAYAQAKISKNGKVVASDSTLLRTPTQISEVQYATNLTPAEERRTGQKARDYQNGPFLCQARASCKSGFTCPQGPAGVLNFVAYDDLPKPNEESRTLVGGPVPPKMCAISSQSPHVFMEPTIAFSNPQNVNTIITAYIRLASFQGADFVRGQEYRVTFDGISVTASMIPVAGGVYKWQVVGTKRTTTGQTVDILELLDDPLDFICYSYHTVNRMNTVTGTVEINGGFDVRGDVWLGHGVAWQQCNDVSGGNPPPEVLISSGFARLQLTPL